jgi:adenylate cyclase
VAADVAGYSRLIGLDEEGTLAALRAVRRDLIDPAIATHNGRLFKTTGDGLLIEVGSIVDALRCADAMLRGIGERNTAVEPDRRIEFRIGVHQGDVVVEDSDVFGDGVNVAARLEGLAEPGGICVSARVQEDAAGKLDLAFADMGDQVLKNIVRPIRVYRVATEGETKAATSPAPLPLPDKPLIAVLPFGNALSSSAQPIYEVMARSPRPSHAQCNFPKSLRMRCVNCE